MIGSSISIVIPVWNEEQYLLRLLKKLSDYQSIDEIIIVDNNSEDDTLRIAQQYHCQIYQGSTPAKSRNIGFLNSTNKIVVFLDADTIISDKVISIINNIFTRNDIGVLHFRIKPITNSKYVKFSYYIMHCYFKILNKVGLSQGLGNCIAVNRDYYSKIKGFNETIKVGEDADFFRRINNICKVAYLSNPCVLTSARRFELENKIIFSFKCLIWSYLRLFGIKKSLFNYRWEKYPKSIFYKESQILS